MIAPHILKRLKKAFKNLTDNQKAEITPIIKKIGDQYALLSGNNKILGRAQFSIAEPYESQKKAGIMALYLQESQILNPQLEVWNPRPLDKIQGRILSRGIRETINLDSLYIGQNHVGSISIDLQIYSRGANLLDNCYLLANHTIKKMFENINPLEYKDKIPENLYLPFENMLKKYQFQQSKMVTTYYLNGAIVADIDYSDLNLATDAISWTFDCNGCIRAASMHGDITGIDPKDIKKMCDLALEKSKIKFENDKN